MKNTNVVIENRANEVRVTLRKLDEENLKDQADEVLKTMVKTNNKYHIARNFLGFFMGASVAGGYFAYLAPTPILKFVGLGVSAISLVGQAISYGFLKKNERAYKQYTNLSIAIYRERMIRKENDEESYYSITQ